MKWNFFAITGNEDSSSRNLIENSDKDNRVIDVYGCTGYVRKDLYTGVLLVGAREIFSTGSLGSVRETRLRRNVVDGLFLKL